MEVSSFEPCKEHTPDLRLSALADGSPVFVVKVDRFGVRATSAEADRGCERAPAAEAHVDGSALGETTATGIVVAERPAASLVDDAALVANLAEGFISGTLLLYRAIRESLSVLCARCLPSE